MARSRYIKPSFFEDTKLSEISIMARYFYVGLWCWMDCHGLIEFDPKLFKRNIFPYDEKISLKSIVELIDELVKTGRLVKMELNGTFLLHCPNFTKHQKIYYNEESKYTDSLKEFKKNHLSSTQVLPENHLSSTQFPLNLNLNLNLNSNSNSNKALRVTKSDLHELAKIWNENCGTLPKVKEMNKKRIKTCGNLWSRNSDNEYWKNLVIKLSTSNYHIGKNKYDWKAGFDFFLREDVQTKILEGSIGSKSNGSSSGMVEE